MQFSARNRFVNERLIVSHDGEFKMPPVGLTSTRYILGGKTYEKFTVRCDVTGCWLVADGLPSKEEADKYLAEHKAGSSNFIDHCPAPPKRESLPSGLAYVEKLWRELDDVAESLATAQSYRGMTLEQMRGYAKGLAFSVVMLEPVHFPSIDSVSRHVRDRRRMRLGEMDWVATPTSRHHNATVMEVKGLHDKGPVAKKPESKAKPISDNVRGAITAALKSGMFTQQELADTYGLSLAAVAELAV